MNFCMVHLHDGLRVWICICGELEVELKKKGSCISCHVSVMYCYAMYCHVHAKLTANGYVL